jgi:hypothetical protein
MTIPTKYWSTVEVALSVTNTTTYFNMTLAETVNYTVQGSVSGYRLLLPSLK